MPSHPNRRTVVRTAVWTVPAVAIATAAPALAVSTVPTGGVNLLLKFDTFNVFGADYNNAGDPTTMESKVQVQNLFQDKGPALTKLFVTVTYPDTRATGGAPTTVTGGGWGYASAEHDVANKAWVYTFLFVGNVATSKSTTELDFRVPLKSADKGDVTVAAAAFSGGGTAVATATNHFK